ncbi:MAG: hypothetical protein KDI13_01605 [Alphaproteobacteria bacterium]|nr:hypothetical protein [Alphaproteobacteria bacterium]
MLYTLDNKKLLAYVQLQDWRNVWDMLYTVLGTCKLQSSTDTFSLFLAKDIREKSPKAEGFCKLLAQIFLTCLTKTDIPFSDEDYERFIFLHEPMHDILFFAGMPDTSAHVQALLASEKKLSPLTQKKILMLLSLDHDQLAPVMKKILVKYRAPALESYLGYTKCFTPQAHDNKVALIGFKSDFRSLPLTHDMMSKVIYPYFKISYIDAPQKHIIKRDLNKYVSDFLEHYKDKIPPSTPRDNSHLEKPVLLVFGEIINDGHAMFRSWASRMNAFREHFHVVLFGMDMKSDGDSIKTMCDEFHQGSLLEIHLVFQKIREINPDMIFYLSVGMSMSTVMLSNVRLAPVQVMALGHPATTYSSYIDAVIGREDYYTPEAFSNDTYIIEDSTVHHSPPVEITKKTLPVPQDGPPKERLRIMLCGMIMKLSAPFLQTVRQLTEELDVPFDVSVITSTKGLDKLAFERYVQTLFPVCKVIEYSTYQRYFELLQETDLILDPFPFGHSHTMIDGLLAGKPLISLRGDEPHGRTEWGILRNLGLADQFAAESLDEYRKKFKILSAQILSGKADFFDPKDVYHNVFEKENTYSYADLLRWIYQNRETVRSRKEKVIRPDLSS